MVPQTERARAFKTFVSEQGWWIEDYAIFRAIHASHRERAWPEWPEALQHRDPAAIDQARRALSREVLFYQYLQWLARHAVEAGARARDSPRRRDLRGSSVHGGPRQRGRLGAPASFRLDASVGAPPDAFNAAGPGLGHAGVSMGRDCQRRVPMAARASQAQRRLVRRLTSGSCRRLLSHLRASSRPEEPFFTPADQPEQEALGERVLAVLREGGARSSQKISAPFPTSSARRWRGSACRAFACSGGSGTGTRKGNRSAIHWGTRRFQWRPRARTTPSRLSCGGKARRPTSAGR